jgi:hypothetical protein
VKAAKTRQNVVSQLTIDNWDSTSRSRRDNDDVWMLPQQDDKHWVQQENSSSTTEGVAGEFNGENSTEGSAGTGEVSENVCAIYEQTQDIFRMNVSVLNTSRVKIKIPELTVTKASPGMSERDSNTKLRK